MRWPRAVRTCVDIHWWYLLTHSTYPRSASSSFVPCSPNKAELTCVGLCQGRLHIESQGYGMAACLCIDSFVRFVRFWCIRSMVDAASKHGCFIPFCLRRACCRDPAWTGWVLRMSETLQSRLGRALGCRGAAAARGGVCFFWPRIFHSNTDVKATQMKCRDVSLH